MIKHRLKIIIKPKSTHLLVDKKKLRKFGKRLGKSLLAYAAVFGILQQGGVIWSTRMYWFIFAIFVVSVVYWHILDEIIGFFCSMKTDIEEIKRATKKPRKRAKKK